MVGRFCDGKHVHFFSFHMAQKVSMASEAITFLLGMVVSDRPVHYSLVDCNMCGCARWKISMHLSWSQSLSMPQSLVVNRHLKKRWSTDSCSCLQRGHSPQLGHPLLANLSKVRILFWMANQTKNFTFCGAQASLMFGCSFGALISILISVRDMTNIYDISFYSREQYIWDVI